MNFIWIDDSSERAESAKNLGKTLEVNVDFVDVKDKNLTEKLSEILAGNAPDLIIIDHNLEESNTGVFKKGSSAAALIRETWPECPIVCVSAVDITQVDSQQKALYEEIFSIEKISDHYLEILSIAESYKWIRENKPENIDDVIKLIKVPEIDEHKIKSIIPAHQYKDPSLSVEISKWVRKTLIKRPGFLYDKLWLSTLLGINVESFYKIENSFKDAEYTGIFCNRNEKRWWKSTALHILYENSKLPGLPWERGRGLNNLAEADFSKSYATEKPFPETVAFVDSSPDAIQVPIKLRESDLHPDFESLLYFEDLRLMRPAE